VFLVDPDVPVREEVVLQGPELDDATRRHVLDPDRPEIGQAGIGADRRELVRLDPYHLGLPRVFVGKGFEDPGVD
jgi:hypothetical protein